MGTKEQETELISGSNKKSRQKSKLSWLWKIPIVFVALFLFLTILVSLIFVFNFSKTFVLRTTVDFVNKEFNGKISFEDIHLNLFKGVVVENLTVTLQSDTIVFVPQARVDWDWYPLFDRKIFVKVVEFNNARINLTKEVGDSLWNLQKFIKHKEKEASKSKTNLTIFLQNVKLNNASITILDKNHKPREKVFDPSAVFLKDLDLNANGKFDLSKGKFEINVNDFSFKENHSNFALKSFSTKLLIDTSEIRVNDIQFETPKTKLKANVLYNPSSSRISFDLIESRIHTSDLLKFAHLPFGSNSVLSLSSKGYFNGDLTFEKGSLEFNSKSKVEFVGNIGFRDNSPKIYFYLNQASISERDVRSLLPQIFQSVPVHFEFFSTKGYSLKLVEKIIFLKGNFVSAVGTINSELKIDTNSILSYDVAFQNLDLKQLLEKLPRTELNGNSKGSFNLNNFSKLNGYLELNIYQGKAKIQGFDNFNLSLFSNFADGKIVVKNLQFSSLLPDTSGKNAMNINFAGNVDISNLKRISYSGVLELSSFQANHFFVSGVYVPERISGKLTFDGVGYDIDNLVLNLQGDINEFSFPDRTLFPFSINISIDHSDPNDKKIFIDSDILKGYIVGRYEISSLIDDLAENINSIINGFEQKINKVFKSDSLGVAELNNLPKRTSGRAKEWIKFHQNKFISEFSINDFSILSILLNTDLVFSGKLRLRSETNETESRMSLDTLFVRYFSLNAGKTKVNLSNALFNLDYEMDIFEGLPRLRSLKASASTENKIIFGNSYLDFLDLSLNYSNDVLQVINSTSLNSTFAAKVDFTTSFPDTLVNLHFNELSLAYQNIFQWELQKPASIFANQKSISIDKIELARENAESVNISGQYYFNDSIDFRGNIVGIPLNDFQKLFPKESFIASIKEFNGKVESFDFSVTNTTENPIISLSLFADGLKVENFEIGNLDVRLQYQVNTLSGKVELSNNSISPLIANLVELPFGINFKKMEFGVIKDKEFSGYIDCERFDLSLLTPFVSRDIDNLQGKAKFSSKVFGYLPDDLRFFGFVDILESSFTPTATNLKYNLKGRIQLDGTKFTLDNLSVNNTREDLKNGSGIVFGNIIFANNRLESIDLYLASNGIKVLSNASVKSMPQLYGDLIISTNPNYLRFNYERNEMLVEGNVNFLAGRLFMPGTAGGKTVQESFVQYEISGTKKIDTTLETTGEEKSKHPTNLKIDLTLRFVQPIELTLDLATIGQIYAIISLEDNASNLRFYSDPKNNIVLLTGNDLVLREGSTLKFIKLFNTEGKINFPTGSIENPGLNLKAYYNGQSIYNDAVRNFTVTIYITGTREKPNLRFDYTIDGQPATDDSTKVAQDAIFLLAFGRTKSEIEKGGVSNNFNLAEVSTSGSSALLSKIVSDALSGTGFISSADILLPPSASSFDRATLKMSGRFLGMTWNFGGTMADLLNNNELSIEVPIGNVLPFNFPNVILQLSRSSSLTQSIQRNQKDWEIKLKYGSTW